MDRAEFVLAVLAASDGAEHTPVQVQKLFFLLDQKVPQQTGGPYFRFAPFHYGPFDPQVYQELERLEPKELVQINRDPHTGWKTYRATIAGQCQGSQFLNTLAPTDRDYIQRLSAWVRGRSFAELVSAVYHCYPEMKANSVFQY